jgi:hypothetical protein
MTGRFLILLFLSLLAGCSSNLPTIDYDTQTNFSKYQYYTLTNNTEKNKHSLMAQRIQKSLKHALTSAPITSASAQHPADFIITFNQLVQEKEKTNQSRSSIGVGGSSGGNVGMGLSLSFPFGESHQQTLSVVINFSDAKTNKLIWRGSKEIKLPKEDAEETTQLVDEVIAEIISAYPPTP